MAVDGSTVDTVRDRFRTRAATMRARGPGPTLLAAVVVAFAIVVRIAIRYLPEYLRVLGAGAALIGLFVSAGVAIRIGCAWIDPPASLRRLTASHRGAAIGTATLGLAAWLLAPAAGADTLRWGGLLAGVVLVSVYAPIGPSVVPLRARDGGTADASRSRRALAVPVGFALAGLVLAFAPTFLAGFEPVLAIGVAIGLVATAFVVSDGRDDGTGSVGEDGDDGGSEPLSDRDRTSPRTPSVGVGRVRSDLRSLSETTYRLLLGDALLRVATGGVAAFLVITVTTVLGVEVRAFGLEFRSDALFGAFAAIETAVALAGSTGTARRTVTRLGRGRVAAASALVVALVPIALVNAPADSLLIGALFGAYGLRTVGRHARTTLARNAIETDLGGSSNERDEPPAGTDTTGAAERVRDSWQFVRDVLVVPSALVGGLLYAVSPQVAFGLATAVALLGLREVLWFLRPGRPD